MKTTKEKLKDAISLAEEFIRRAKTATESSEDLFGGKHTASAKRASMDLTRSLAELRKGNYQ